MRPLAPSQLYKESKVFFLIRIVEYLLSIEESRYRSSRIKSLDHDNQRCHVGAEWLKDEVAPQGPALIARTANSAISVLPHRLPTVSTKTHQRNEARQKDR
jgi:hypothetical protein